MVYCTKIDSGFLSCCLEIILEVHEGLSPPFRPAVSLDTCGVKWMALMASCWSENPESRKIRINPSEGTNGKTKYLAQGRQTYGPRAAGRIRPAKAFHSARVYVAE